jgi:hypothetical protein
MKVRGRLTFSQGNNTGYWNTGYWNTGYWNTGDRNTGNRNTGYWNTGYCNTGYWNTGDRNTGYCNTGDWNTGYCNTGYWNATKYSSGFFCLNEPQVISFDKPVKNIKHDDFINRADVACLGNALMEDKKIDWDKVKTVPNITKAKLAELHKRFIEARKAKEEGR